MIEYWKGPFSLNIVFQIHGSVIYGSILPGIVSVCLFFIFRTIYPSSSTREALFDAKLLEILVVSYSFTLVYRVQFCNDRYWQACGAAHLMMSRFLDATVTTALFHMQNSNYKKIKPPSLYDHPDSFNPNVYLDRETLDESQNLRRVQSPYRSKTAKRASTATEYKSSIEREESLPVKYELPILPHSLVQYSRLDGGWGMLFNNTAADGNSLHSTPLFEDIVKSSSSSSVKENWAHDVTPSLFLQELAHLSSLLVAVSFCTLKHQNPSPNNDYSLDHLLTVYERNQPWPKADPYKIRNRFNSPFGPKTQSYSKLYIAFRNILGIGMPSKTDERFYINRPMPVLGGVSQHELKLLNQARGASAKNTLCFYWISEFVTREMMRENAIHPGIQSRIHQFLSAGSVQYNILRQILYIPFPYVYDQLMCVLVIPLILIIPFMMTEYVKSSWLGATLSFFTITCLFGLLEVGRGLEEPFSNIPHDVPLNTLMAMYNECLISTCRGFHPDHFWFWEEGQESRTSFRRGSENNLKDKKRVKIGRCASTHY